jgi:hypothetical protein
VFCALLHRFEPQLIDYPNMVFTPETALPNMDLAFKQAATVGIPAFLDAEDIVEIQDAKSIYTYLTR